MAPCGAAGDEKERENVVVDAECEPGEKADGHQTHHHSDVDGQVLLEPAREPDLVGLGDCAHGDDADDGRNGHERARLVRNVVPREAVHGQPVEGDVVEHPEPEKRVPEHHGGDGRLPVGLKCALDRRVPHHVENEARREHALEPERNEMRVGVSVRGVHRHRRVRRETDGPVPDHGDDPERHRPRRQVHYGHTEHDVEHQREQPRVVAMGEVVVVVGCQPLKEVRHREKRVEPNRRAHAVPTVGRREQRLGPAGVRDPRTPAKKRRDYARVHAGPAQVRVPPVRAGHLLRVQGRRASNGPTAHEVAPVADALVADGHQRVQPAAPVAEGRAPEDDVLAEVLERRARFPVHAAGGVLALPEIVGPQA